jgi:hypothetical protein
MSLLDTASLIVTPNGYKEGKLYSVIPSDGSGDMSVVRATTATRVNSAGLVELVPYNLVQYSEQFDNAYWQKVPSGAATVSVSANSTTAPNGTLTADLVTITRSSITELSSIIANTAAPLGTYKNSIWLKAKDSASVGKTIDIWSWEGVTRGYTMITLTADWVRYEQATTIFSVTTSNELFAFGLLPSSFSTSTTTSVEFYAWGGQSVEGSTAKDYQKTETRLNIPRLDYSNGTCPSLLVEPQRTNLFTYSSSFDNAAWGKDTSVTITANYAIAPDGTTTAERMQKSTTSGVEGISQNFFGLPSGNYTLTFYVKSNTGSNQNAFLLYGNFQTTAITITSEWQRVSVSFSAATSVDYNGILAANSLDILIWGAQLEAGNYSTSYIPTTSASVTRNADVISKTGISSLIGQTEGTIFWDIYVDTPSASLHEDIFNIDGGTFGNTIYLAKLSNAAFACEMYVSNVQQATFTKTGITAGRHKIAFAYANNNTAMFFDGVQVGSTDTSCSVPTMSRIQLGQGVLGPSTGFTNAAALWQTRLDNATLATLTTI